ncbi:MAG: transglycosylase SLT domain-containing protein [Mycobacterium sp.]
MESLKAYAIALLTRGHRLYEGEPERGQRRGAVPAKTAQTLAHHADRLAVASTRAGMGLSAPTASPAIAGLRRAARADTELATVLADAHTDHTPGHDTSRAVLADAHGDPMPAFDTALGRREALRRMAARVRLQRQTLRRSGQHSRLLAHRARHLAYSVRERIGAALDQLGITDPAARRNWLRGYQTLIARESGGRPSAVASEPTTSGCARGLTQTTPTTFAQYHQPGTSTNIFDPVANICASMNYVMQRYGVSADGAKLAALVQQADARRPPKGY